MAAILTNTPVVIHEHAGANRKPRHYRLVDGLLARRTSRIITVSHAVKESLLRLTGTTPAKITVLHNCFDKDRFDQTLCDPRSLRQQIGISPDALVIGVVARLMPYKGVDIALRAIKKVLSIHSNLQLVIIGDGQEEQNLKELAHDLGIDHSVRFLGKRTDVAQWYKVFDVFLLPSRMESFGMALVEALYSEVAVIASNIEGPKEIIDPGTTGLLFPCEDEEALTEALLSLLENPGTRRTLAMEGRKSVSNQFSPARYLDQLEALYGDLLFL